MWYKVGIALLLGACSSVQASDTKDTNMALDSGPYKIEAWYGSDQNGWPDFKTDVVLGQKDGRYTISTDKKVEGIVQANNFIEFNYSGPVENKCKSVKVQYSTTLIPRGPTSFRGHSTELITLCSKECLCRQSRFSIVFSGLKQK